VAGRLGGERFVVLRGPPPTPDEPLQRAARIRSACLAVRYLAESEEEAAPAAGPAAGPTPAPLLTELDLQKATTERLAWTDRAAVAAVGACLALALLRIVRNLPRA
jgi:hypothetical protein